MTMDMDSDVGVDYRSGVGGGWAEEEGKRGKIGTTNRINKNNFFNLLQ